MAGTSVAAEAVAGGETVEPVAGACVAAEAVAGGETGDPTGMLWSITTPGWLCMNPVMQGMNGAHGVQSSMQSAH